MCVFSRFLAAALTLLIVALPLAPAARAQEGQEAQDVLPTLLVLDYSNSMWDSLGEGAKLQETRRILRSQLARGAGSFQNLGLMAYGHREADSCTDIELIHAPGTASLPDMLATAEGLTPTGETPLTQAVRQGAAALKGAGTIILITDGTESCQQDPCTVADELAADPADIRVHIIAVGMDAGDAQSLSCLPERTGGLLMQAGNREELQQAFDTTRQAVEAATTQAQLTTQVGTLTQETTGQDFKIEALEETIRRLEGELATAQALILDGTGQGGQAPQTDPQIDNVLLQRVAELEVLIARLEQENASLAASLSGMDATNVALQSQVAALAAELANARGLADQMQRALQESEGETALLGQSYEALLAQIQSLQDAGPEIDQCGAVGERLGRIEGELRQQRDQNAALQQLLAAAQASRAEGGNAGAQTGDPLAQCSAQINAALSEVDTITGQMANLLNERETLIQRNGTLESALEARTAQHIKALNAFDEQQDKLNDREAEIMELQGQIAQLSGEQAESAQQLRIALREIEGQRSALDALEGELARERDINQDSLDAASARLAETRAALATTEDELTAARAERDATAQMNTSLQLAIDQIQGDNAGKDAALAAAKTQSAEHLNAFNQERLRTQGLTARLERSQAHIASLIEQLETTACCTPEPEREAEQEQEAEAEPSADQAAQEAALQALRDDLATAQESHAAALAEISGLKDALAAKDAQCTAGEGALTAAQAQIATLTTLLSAAQDEGASCQAALEEMRAATPRRDGPDQVFFEVAGAAPQSTSSQSKEPESTLPQAIVWQVSGLDTPYARSGQGQSLSLPETAGRYEVRALFGDRSVAHTFEVLDDETRRHAFALRSGQVTLRFADTLPQEYRQEVQVTFTPIDAQGEGLSSQSVTDSFLSTLSLTLPLAPGEYAVTARAPGLAYEQRVFIVPSDPTEIVLPWQAGLVRLSFVDFATGEAIRAPVTWRLMQGDARVLSGTGALQLPLARGAYQLEANIGGITAQQSFVVSDGAAQTVPVAFDKGQITLGFMNQGQPIVDAGFYWNLYDAEGNRLIASGSAEDTEVVVDAGTYRLEGFFGDATRVETLTVEVAARTPGTLDFSSGLVQLSTDLAMGAGGTQGLVWRFDRKVGGVVTASQSFTTQDAQLSTALEPGTYQVTVSNGDQERSATLQLSAGVTTPLSLQ